MSFNHAGENITQIGVWLDVVQLRCLDQRTDHRPPDTATIAAREQMIFAPEGNHPFILPMSGKKSRSITVGIPSMVAVFGSNTASSAPAAGLSTSRRRPA